MKYTDWVSHGTLASLSQASAARYIHSIVMALFKRSGGWNVVSGQIEVWNDFERDRRMLEVTFDSSCWTGCEEPFQKV